MLIYIAGPMRSYDNYNFDAFDNAADYIKSQGHYPVSPTNIDRVFEGWGKYPPEGIEFIKHDLIRFMDRDLNAIQGCDAIYLLKGWEESSGARVEKAYADFLGLFTFYEVDGLL